MKSLITKTLVVAAMISIIAFSLCTSARAQFSSNLTNVKLSGAENHVLANATITFDASSVFLYKQHSVTANQILYVSDSSGTVSPLSIGGNLTISAGTLSAASTNPTITLAVPTGFGVTGSPLTGSGTLTINTTLSGILKGNGSGIIAATNGTDYISPTVSATLTNKTISGANNTLTVRAASDITGILPVVNGGTGLALGTSGGVPYFSTSNTISASAALDASKLLVGGGAGSSPTTIASLGTATTVLHGNATGVPSFGFVDLGNETTGVVPFANGGTGLSSGSSGGLVYFNTTSSLASSSALTANRIVIGGGAGVAPGVLSSAGTTTTVLHGNATGLPSYGATALTTDVTGILPVANGGTGLATLTSNNIIMGNGTGTVAFLAPGTSGNIVTSNGTAWVSSAAGSGVTSVAMTVPAMFSISGSPITSTGTLAVSYSGTALPVANGGTGTTTGNITAPGNLTFTSGDTRLFLRSTIGSGSNYYVVQNSIGAAEALYAFSTSDTIKWYHGMESDFTYMVYDGVAAGVALKIVTGGGVQNRGTATNDNAATGFVGQFVSSLVAVGSPVSLTNATAANITSISLTAGDWDVEANANFAAASATVTATQAGIGSTTATLPTDGSEVYSGVQVTLLSETDSITCPRKRFSLSGTTTIYLVAQCTFSAGTVGGFGQINARRVR